MVSPIDLAIDAIPVLGQANEATGIAGIMIDGVIGYLALKKSREATSKRFNEKQPIINLEKIKKKC
jgi:uncharacterized membrane protein YkvA (DUF1232 family)